MWDMKVDVRMESTVLVPVLRSIRGQDPAITFDFRKVTLQSNKTCDKLMVRFV